MFATKNYQRPRGESQHQRGGFTLMEVLLVLVILVVLASLSVSVFRGTQERALKDAARAKVSILKGQINTFEMHTRHYPSSLQDLINQPSDSTLADRWAGPYLEDENALLDPWDNEYRFQAPGKHNPEGFDVWSAGPDGQDGSEDDIGNWTNS